MFDNQDHFKIKRCVIYTRKSTEDGLEQEFNSLDAQREACEAYVKSQAHEGWQLIEKHYDDGGFSGGTMNRPSLSQLMQDIETGEIDIIVVYKIDRLSRSLADFSKMVEIFDQHEVSFISITQQFNTSSSMGRLTLNVLLSFAQFEREVTGERIRDKRTASMKKGMWMGGPVPIGYDNVERSLTVNEQEASRVKYIFERYKKLRSAKLLKNELDLEEIRSKHNKPFSRGALYTILKNPIYIGKVRLNNKNYDGQHDAIIDLKLWKAVQSTIKKNRHDKYHRTKAKSPSLFAGLIVDSDGNRFTAAHSRKKNHRYRYYVNQAVLQYKQLPPDAITRMPAQTLENLIVNDLISLLRNSPRLLSITSIAKLTATDQKSLIDHAQKLADSWKSLDIHQQIENVNKLFRKITLSKSRVTIDYSLVGVIKKFLPSSKLGTIDPYRTELDVKLKRCGLESKLIVEGSDKENPPKPPLISLHLIQKALKNGLIWNQALLDGDAKSANELAKANNVSDRYVASAIKLAFLSPAIIERIFKGDIPPDTSLSKIKKNFSFDWNEQEKLFL